MDGILRLIKRKVNEPVNLGNPTEMTVTQIAQAIISATGSSSQIVYHPLPVDDPKVRQPDIARARNLLKWSPRVELDEGLRITIKYFQEKLSSEK